jgi:hypothetical protein
MPVGDAAAAHFGAVGAYGGVKDESLPLVEDPPTADTGGVVADRAALQRQCAVVVDAGAERGAVFADRAVAERKRAVVSESISTTGPPPLIMVLLAPAPCKLTLVRPAFVSGTVKPAYGVVEAAILMVAPFGA